MPAGIKDAFKSPFHSMYPSSQFHDISSYTRSSGTESIHNEAVQAHMNSEFNTNYRLDDTGSSQSSQLPKYTPSIHDTTDEEDSDSESDLIEFKPKRHKEPTGHTGTKVPTGPTGTKVPNKETTCDDLIHQVLTNKKCRQILKRILLENDTDSDNEPDNEPATRKTRVSEGLAGHIQNLDSDTVKNILIYSIGGLLLLCVLDLLFKMGQLLK